MTGHHYVWGEIEESSSSVGTWKTSPGSRSWQSRDRNVANSVKSIASEVRFLTESESLTSATPKATSSSSIPATGGLPSTGSAHLVGATKKEAGEHGRSRSRAAASGRRGSKPSSSDEDSVNEVDSAVANDTTLQDELSGIIWSKGSAKHSAGRCRPCHYFHTSTGCLGGASCKFCHIPHTRIGKRRLGMSKRLLCKRVADALENKYKGDPEGYRAAVEKVSSRSSFLRKLLERKDELGSGQGEGGDDCDGVDPLVEGCSVGPVAHGLESSSGDDRGEAQEDRRQPRASGKTRSGEKRTKSVVSL